MRIQLVSDTHLECYQPDELIYAMLFPQTDAEVLVIAGDMGTIKHVPAAMAYLAPRYEHIVYVRGNHEYYNTDAYTVNRICSGLPKNVHVLDNEAVTIEGVRFVGTTLWFPDSRITRTKDFPDFDKIQDFDSWIWTAHQQARDFLADTLQEGDVLVTHHAPSYRSVAPMYQGAANNDFFVGDIEPLILDRKPRFAFHGHMHEACQYRLGSTDVVCNPFGYFMEKPDQGDIVVCDLERP